MYSKNVFYTQTCSEKFGKVYLSNKIFEYQEDKHEFSMFQLKTFNEAF